ncbi:hypothetical protein [Thalassococcus sp. S3]|uniref:hypothetical protein n=1 Tax=Thalassococcus sp. S3 TaxID=2017482 RepID=UPI00102405E8|nr:hypothetical protein [Thalassococcus sp. S3]QBF32217.1 hypothetical protein CFI11_13455 [Thalassococcus sp. S3]
MAKTPSVFFETLGMRCRDVAAALIGGLWIGRSSSDVVADIASLPARQQIWFTAVTLVLLFLFSLFAAQFGLIGMALYWLGVIAIIA